MKRLSLLLSFLLLASLAAFGQAAHQVGAIGTANQILPLNAAPLTCQEGDVYHDLTTHQNYQCLQGLWSPFAAGTGGGGGSTNIAADYLLSGCGVEYTSALTFKVAACQYVINGVTYSSPLTTVTLSAADPTNSRIDAIIVDTVPEATKITGTPSATPSSPVPDPSTQIGLTYPYVAAGATTPSNITQATIYTNNTGWTCTASANFNCASTSNPPGNETYDVEATSATTGNNVTFVKPASGTDQLTNYNTLFLLIRSKATWPKNRALNLTWFNGTTQVGVPVNLSDGTFGFASSNTSAYQLIAVPVGLFATNGATITTLKASVAGSGGTIGFYADDVILQGGVSQTSTANMTFKGAWTSTATYNANNVVTNGGQTWIALVQNTNVTPVAGSTWALLAGPGTVTSIAMTGDGTIYNSSVTGSPITSSGTFAPTLVPVAANQFLGGPQSSANANVSQISAVGSTSSGNSVQTSFSGNVTAGNMISCAVTSRNHNASTPYYSITDGQSNTYTIDQQALVSNGASALIHACPAASGSAGNIVASYTGTAAWMHIVCQEVNTTNCTADTGNTATTAGVSPASIQTAGNVAQANEFTVAFFADNYYSTQFSSGSGYTAQFTYNVASGQGSDSSFILEDQNATSSLSGKQTATANWTSAFTNQPGALIETYKLTGSNTTQTPTYHTITDGALPTDVVRTLNLGVLAYAAAGTTTMDVQSFPRAIGFINTTHSTTTTFKPVNLVAGGFYRVIITQDSTGGAVTFTLGTAGGCASWKIAGGGAGAITLTATASAQDELDFWLDNSNGTNVCRGWTHLNEN